MQDLLQGVVDANNLLECKQDQVINPWRSLYEGLISLTGEYKSEDQAGPAIADFFTRILHWIIAVRLR